MPPTSRMSSRKPPSPRRSRNFSRGRPMDERERHDAGMAKRRKILGNAWVDRAQAKKNDFNGEFQDLISRYAWGEIWTRPGLDDRTRRLIVLASMIALGRWEEFRMHTRAAIVEGKMSRDDIKEVILQQ